MKKIMIILSIIITIIISNKEYESITIPNEAIRIRVIANSNNLEDQLLKLKVKDNITSNLYKKLENVDTIEEARNNVKNSIKELDGIVHTTLNNDNYEINFGNNYFPKKTLNGIEYEEGNYESLVVKLGEAKGNNWWCVLFPPLCMIEAEYKDVSDVEYKSKVLEILNKYK